MKTANTLRKNWPMRVGAGALTVAMLTLCAVSGTFAKYTTTVQGYDTANIARFGYQATDGATPLTTAEGTQINLFRTAATSATGTVADRTAPGVTGGLKMAPGVSGYFTIVLDGTQSDVDLDLAETKVDLDAATLPAAYSALTGDNARFLSVVVKTTVDAPAADLPTTAAADATYTTATAARLSLSEFSTKINDYISGAQGSKVLKKNTKGVINVCWKWVSPDTSNDTIDTGIGQAFNQSTEVYPKYNVNNTVNQRMTPVQESDYITNEMNWTGLKTA